MQFLKQRLISCAHIIRSFKKNDVLTEKQFTLKKENFFADISLFQNRNFNENSNKLLIILPPTGGTNTIDRSYAKIFSSSGYDVIILNDWSGSKDTQPDFSLHQRVHQGAQAALDLILSQFTYKFIGLLGTSLGGVFASTAAHNLKNINSVFTITAGTPISEVIVHSKQKELEKLKNYRAEKLGVTSDVDQINSIRKVFYLEPLDLPPEHKNKDLGMVIASKDTVVPAFYQYKLRDFWQPEKVIELKFDHFWGIVNTWLFYNSEIINFFEKCYQNYKIKDAPTKY